MKKGFKEKVLAIVSKIPKGGTMSYKEVAETIGHKKSWRAVGSVLSKNYDSKIPCHRVVRSDGDLGGYNRGKKTKARLLESERNTKNPCY